MTGRPSGFTPEIAEEIINRMLAGMSLRRVVQEMGIAQGTVINWQNAHPQFMSDIARAREAQADVLADQILDIAENCTAETAMADRVAIGALQWLAGKRQPKRYGDAISLKHGDPDGKPLAAIINVTIGGKKPDGE